MKTKYNILLISFFILLGCSEITHSNKIINIDVKRLTVLKASYPLMFYNDNSVGSDVSKPIYSDTIIILKNKLSEQYKFNNLNKIKYLDSISLCKLVLKNDLYHFGQNKEKFILLQPFLSLKKKGDTIKIFAVTWGASYYEQQHCVELERILIQNYLPNNSN